MSRERHDHSQKMHHQVFRCGPLTLLANIYTDYGTTTSSDLTSNENCITTRWNPYTPIAGLFQQLNDVKEFAQEGNKIINVSQLLCLCYNNVQASVIFRETLKTWREKTDINKTYAKFVPFVTQQEEVRINNQTTSGTAGFSNSMVDRIVY